MNNLILIFTDKIEETINDLYFQLEESARLFPLKRVGVNEIHLKNKIIKAVNIITLQELKEVYAFNAILTIVTLNKSMNDISSSIALKNMCEEAGISDFTILNTSEYDLLEKDHVTIERIFCRAGILRIPIITNNDDGKEEIIYTFILKEDLDCALYTIPESLKNQRYHI